MTVTEAVRGRRTIRKFTQEPVTREQLEELVDLARVAPCSANMQPLKYKLITGADTARVFPFLNWAVAIAPRGEPKPEERPTAYIVVCVDTAIRPKNTDMDVGIAAQTIALAAWERGIGTCLMALHDKPGLTESLALPSGIVPALGIALGWPAHRSEIIPMADGQYRYHMTDDGNFHVPKRPLSEILL